MPRPNIQDFKKKRKGLSSLKERNKLGSAIGSPRAKESRPARPTKGEGVRGKVSAAIRSARSRAAKKMAKKGKPSALATVKSKVGGKKKRKKRFPNAWLLDQETFSKVLDKARSGGYLRNK